MAAIGKTLDLFEVEADATSAPAREKTGLKSARKTDPSDRKALLHVARTSVIPAATTATAREELWLAIWLPHLPLEALGQNISGAISSRQSSSQWLAASTFHHVTREVQPGSRRGSMYGGSTDGRASQPDRSARSTTSNDRGRSDINAPSDHLVVIDTSHNQQRVVACNEQARAAGITPGTALNAAYALAGDLDVRSRDPQAEQRLLENLAQWAGAFTPRVCLEPPDMLLLEVRGSVRLFGGHQSLLELAGSALNRKNIQAQLALAPTSLAAMAFARTGPGLGCLHRARLPAALSKVPITTLRWSEECIATLHDMGVQTIGDCLRLPREGFARRFGPETLLQLDQLLGRAPQPRRHFVARERFSWRTDFEAEIESHAHLVHALTPVIEEMERFLRHRQMGVQALEFRLRHRDREPTRVVLRFVRATSDARHCMEVLAEQLERVVLPAPVIAARVRSGSLWPLEMETVAHRLLQETQTDTQAIARLVERLRARLGSQAVYSLRCIEEHRPELASRLDEPRVTRKKARKRAHTSRHALPRPFWILPQPELLQAKRGWPHRDGRLKLCQGPERIESGWWDGNDVSRDYYMAETADGLRLWVYRERRSRQWYLHGIYG